MRETIKEEISISLSEQYANEKINLKLLDQLYLYANRSMITIFLLGILLTGVLQGTVPSFILFPWILALTVLVLNRYYDIQVYLQQGNNNQYTKWHRRFFSKAVLTALLWGIVPFLFLPYIVSPVLQVFVLMMIVGLSGGAMSSLSPDTRLARTYLVTLLLPFSIYFVLQETAIGLVSFVVILIYLATLFGVNKHAYQTLLHIYRQEEEMEGAKRALWDKQEDLDNLFQQTPVGVFYFDTDFTVLNCNAALGRILRTNPEDLIGFDLRKLPDQRPVETLNRFAKGGAQVYRGPYRSIKGDELWIEVKLSPLVNSDGRYIGGVGLLENKTREKEATDELNYMARHDELTSLHNRRSFREYMLSLVKDPTHQTYYSVLFYLDLNQFKPINDTMGHSVGDRLLVLVAERLKKIGTKDTMLSRLGGDEFTIVFPFCATDHAAAYRISEAYGEKIQELFSSAFIIDELHLYIKSSIGIVIIEPGTGNIEELIRYADISMYQAKKEGNSRFAYYNSALDNKRKELFKLQHDLHHAITSGELELFYQPVVSIEDNRLLASEALLRWNHKEKGLLSPSEFIDLAIESGLIDDIGWKVIYGVCKQISEWKTKGIYTLEYISININARQLLSYRFVEHFFEVLESCGIDPSEIKIEITERSLIDNFEQTNGVIKALQERGVRCAIDDFGIGYSSLSYLQKLAFSMLKIDREFIKDILIDNEDRFLVESIIMIAKRFDYKVVVEGIETEAQKAFIAGIDPAISYQGYLFSPAICAEEFEKQFLNRR